MLCRNCQSIFTGRMNGVRDDEVDREKRNTFHRTPVAEWDIFSSCDCNDRKTGEGLATVRNLKAGAGANHARSLALAEDEDCHLCTILQNQLSTQERGKIGVVTNMNDKHWLWNSMIKYEVMCYEVLFLTYGTESGNGIQKDVYLLMKKGSLWMDRVQIDESLIGSSTSTATYATWKIALHWLNKCIKTHSICGHKHDATYPGRQRLPTRLIDISSKGDLRHLALRETKHFHSKPDYLTLSHCWGNIPILTLTTANEQAFRKSIPFESLSRTFQDAIKICKRLQLLYGVRYIWIDSLCIIQDSVEDWRSEVSKMGNVYQNSFCTIAATASADGLRGLFSQRNALLVRPCKVDSAWSGISTFPLLCLEIDSFAGGSWSPLNARGWVVQERFLSPRTLHFAADQVYWECMEHEASEMYPGGVPGLVYPNFKKRPALGKPWDTKTSLAKAVKISQQPGAIWSNMMDTYTATTLSHPEDKLVAISGIASLLQKSLGEGSRYLAGLWGGSENLIEQLLWFAYSGCTESVFCPKPYIAPSWSWASLEGSVHTRSPRAEADDRDYLVEILDARTFAVGQDPFGQLRGGYVHLSGVLYKLKPDEWNRGATRVRAGLHFDYAINPMSYGDSATQDLYCMPFIETKTPSTISDTITLEYEGLILVPTGLEKGQFTRCGMYFKMLSFFVVLILTQEGITEFASVDESGRMTITII